MYPKDGVSAPERTSGSLGLSLGSKKSCCLSFGTKEYIFLLLLQPTSEIETNKVSPKE